MKYLDKISVIWGIMNISNMKILEQHFTGTIDKIINLSFVSQNTEIFQLTEVHVKIFFKVLFSFW